MNKFGLKQNSRMTHWTDLLQSMIKKI
jgi:hypothetical protein